MPIKPRYEDENEDFEASDSDDEYNESEKQLLNKVRNRKKEYSDSEDEVFNVGTNEDDEEEEDYDDGADDDDDDKSDLALSDIEGQDDDDDLPDVRAWGKEKRKYYSTDYVDPDYGGFQGKDAHLAELEEEEARNLQKQLAQQLDDDDFTLEVFSKKNEEEKEEVTEEIIKTDISKLSKRQKLQILQKESPEFFGLVEDFQAKMLVVKDYLSPILKKSKNKQIPDCRAIDFVQTQYELILNYCTNIYMYLLLKASKVNIQNHPIVKRLYQYRQLLSQLEPIFEEIIKPQIEILLKELQSEEENLERKTQKKKTLKLLATLAKTKEGKKKKNVAFEDTEQPSKKMKIDGDDTNQTEENLEIDFDKDQSDSGEDSEKEEPKEEDQNEEDVEKRAITYQMAKNKGLTPHRKKEQRNPRVKHKLKYRKALIRRKGAVRDARKELSRYSGEISGIKSTVSKSIKLKT